MTKRGIAVIGAGMGMAPHGLSLVDLRDRVDVIGIYSRSAERRNAAASRYGFPASADVAALISDPRVSAVLILTPPAAHLEIVRLAAASGKHILLEKPVDVSTERARETVRIARHAGVKLGVVLQNRTRTSSLRLRALIGRGELGELASASASIRWWRAQTYYNEPGRGTRARDGGGVLLTQAIHALDLFLSFTGPAVAVSAMAGTSRMHRMECEDVVAGAMRFANGAIGSVDATTASYPGFPERLEFVFTQATAVLVGEALTVYRHDGSREQVSASAEGFGGGADPMGYSHLQHRALIEDFLDALDNDGDPIVSGVEALKVHLMIDALLEAAVEGSEVPVLVA